MLEKHWNGALLDSVSKVPWVSKGMICNGIHPIVKQADQLYKTGVKLTKLEMRDIEKWSIVMPYLGQ